MFRIIFALILSLLIAFGVYGYFQSRSAPPEPISVTASPAADPSPEPLSFQASFLIFTNGTRRDFTSSRYHNLSSAVFLTPEQPSVVQVRESGLTWQEFFDTLPMKLDGSCLVTGTGQNFCSNEQAQLRFFLNGEEDPTALNREINSGAKLLVTYGSQSDVVINTQLSQIPGVK